MPYLFKEVTVLNEGPLSQGCMYISKGGCVPINLLNLMCTTNVYCTTIVTNAICHLNFYRSFVNADIMDRP